MAQRAIVVGLIAFLVVAGVSFALADTSTANRNLAVSTHNLDVALGRAPGPNLDVAPDPDPLRSVAYGAVAAAVAGALAALTAPRRP